MRHVAIAFLSLIGLCGCGASQFDKCLGAEKQKLMERWSAGSESVDPIETALLVTNVETEVAGFPAVRVLAARWLLERLQSQPLSRFDRESDRYFRVNPYPESCDEGCTDDYWERFESHGPPAEFGELWATYLQVWDVLWDLDKGEIHTEAYNQAVADFGDPEYADRYGIPIQREITAYALAYDDVFSAADRAAQILDDHQSTVAAEICNTRGLYK